MLRRSTSLRPNFRGLCPSSRVTLPFLAGYFVSYVYRSINAVIGPDLVREFGLTAAGLGLLSGIYFFAFALFQLPLGVLLDRYGPRRVNAALLLVAAVGGRGFRSRGRRRNSRSPAPSWGSASRVA